MGNQEVDRTSSFTAMGLTLPTCFYLKTSAYISCLMKHHPYVILYYVLLFNYSALYVVLRVVCEFEANIIYVGVLYIKGLPS